MPNLKRYIHTLLLFLFLIVSRNGLKAQQPAFQVIKGLPTNEVYDLLIDSKGLLWIAHDQGLSRYDGKTFKHFKSPEQGSRAVTGLTEDKYGRVWCYNFNDQILWVKDDVMHVLKEYSTLGGSVYPRFTICNNELFAASAKGIFIYDLGSNKSRWLLTPYVIFSITKINDQIVAGTYDGVYLYTKEKKLSLKLWKDIAPELYATALTLQNAVKGDTIYGIKASANCYYRFVVNGDEIKKIDLTCAGSYINTISNINSHVWIHCKGKSYNLNTKEEIDGKNISDIVEDREGNYWFSSLKFGLMMLPGKKVSAEHINLPLRKGDYVRNTAFLRGQVIYGTQGGDVFAMDTTSGKAKLLFSDRGAGAIEHLYIYDSSRLVISPSVGLYYLNILANGSTKLQALLPEMPVKDVSFAKDFTVVSSMSGMMLFAPLSKPFTDSSWSRPVKERYYGMNDYNPLHSILYWREERCRTAVVVPFNNAILSSHRSGLYEWKVGQEQRLVSYDGKLVNASSLVSFTDKVFIGTATDNILVYDRNGLHALFGNEVRNPGSILQLVPVGNQLWIVTTYGIQIIDASTERVIGHYELPGVNPASIMDIEKVGKKVLMTFADAVCSLPADQYSKLPRPVIDLSYITVNDRDTLTAEKNVLAYNQSDLRFYLSSPWYSGSNSIYIAYRLIGNTDTTWQYIPKGDAPIFYASLPPGEYHFEAKAFHQLSNYSSELVGFDFIIKKPWWQSFLFITTMILFIVGVVGYIVRKYYRERLKKERQYYEKELAIEKERQRISADIHDELGGTLSGIRLMAEITSNKFEEDTNIQNELHNIHSSVSNLTQKLKEVIWSLSNENNSLESLLDYLFRKGKELFVNSQIVFSVSLPAYIPETRIKGEKRRHIYLAVKEALHNALKHSEANAVSLQFDIRDKVLLIIIQDNGKAFKTPAEAYGQGIRNMQERMRQVGGKMDLNTGNGVQIIFTVPV